MGANDKGVKVTLSDSYLAEGAVTQYQWVILGTNPNQVKTPAAQGVLMAGIAMEDAADGEPVEVAVQAHRIFLIDGTGAIAIGTALSNHGTNYGRALAAASGDYVHGYVVGNVTSAAGEFLMAKIDCLNPHILA